MKLEKAIARFWSKVGEPTETGCREWLGPVKQNGYGGFRFRGRDVTTHRFSAWLSGLLVELKGSAHGLGNDVVRHTCDNPRCVEPTHLQLGTTQDNTQDRVDRGRSARRPGVLHHMVKLSEQDVLDIRDIYAAGGISMKKLGAGYGVNATTIFKIVRGKRWGHL